MPPPDLVIQVGSTHLNDSFELLQAFVTGGSKPSLYTKTIIDKKMC